MVKNSEKNSCSHVRFFLSLYGKNVIGSCRRAQYRLLFATNGEKTTKKFRTKIIDSTTIRVIAENKNVFFSSTLLIPNANEFHFGPILLALSCVRVSRDMIKENKAVQLPFTLFWLAHLDGQRKFAFFITLAYSHGPSVNFIVINKQSRKAIEWNIAKFRLVSRERIRVGNGKVYGTRRDFIWAKILI